MSDKKSAETERKPAARTGIYIAVGLTLTLTNFLMYNFFAQVVLQTNDLLWIASMISYVFAAFFGYFLHSRLTWKDREVSKMAVVKFFIWNFLTALAISPFFTWVFGFVTPVYEIAYNIISAIGIPFSYEFVESTGIFGLPGIVTMSFNYLFYDKFVFGEKKSKDSNIEKGIE